MGVGGGPGVCDGKEGGRGVPLVSTGAPWRMKGEGTQSVVNGSERMMGTSPIMRVREAGAAADEEPAEFMLRVQKAGLGLEVNASGRGGKKGQILLYLQSRLRWPFLQQRAQRTGSRQVSTVWSRARQRKQRRFLSEDCGG